MALAVQPGTYKLFEAVGSENLGLLTNHLRLLEPARVLARLGLDRIGLSGLSSTGCGRPLDSLSRRLWLRDGKHLVWRYAWVLSGAGVAARQMEAGALLCSASHPRRRALLAAAGHVPLPRNLPFLARDPGGMSALPKAQSEWWLTRGDSHGDEDF